MEFRLSSLRRAHLLTCASSSLVARLSIQLHSWQRSLPVSMRRTALSSPLCPPSTRLPRSRPRPCFHSYSSWTVFVVRCMLRHDQVRRCNLMDGLQTVDSGNEQHRAFAVKQTRPPQPSLVATNRWLIRRNLHRRAVPEGRHVDQLQRHIGCRSRPSYPPAWSEAAVR
jgi:hypothetical protein